MADRTSEVGRILDDYLEQVARGAAPDRAALMAEHPDLAESLQACLASLEWIDAAARRQCDVAEQLVGDRIATRHLVGTNLQLAVSLDRRKLALASYQGDVWFGDTRNGELAPFDVGLKTGELAVALAHDDCLLVSHLDGTLDVWNTATRALLASRRLPGPVGRFAVSSDGQFVALISQGFGLYDLDALTPRFEKQTKPSVMLAMAISPDDRLLAIASKQGPIMLLDTETGEQVGSLVGHQMGAESVAFAPDGRTLAGAGRDGTVRLWNIPTRQELFILRRLESGIFLAVDFSPDGRKLAAATSIHDGRGWLFVWSAASPSPTGSGP
ncbi:MAG: WD40 repeat domain-containing protein [Pirellulales bacterium]